MIAVARIAYDHERTNAWRGLYFAENGQPVPLERALNEGFVISANDAPFVATLLEQHLRSQAENSK